MAVASGTAQRYRVSLRRTRSSVRPLPRPTNGSTGAQVDLPSQAERGARGHMRSKGTEERAENVRKVRPDVADAGSAAAAARRDSGSRTPSLALARCQRSLNCTKPGQSLDRARAKQEQSLSEGCSWVSCSHESCTWHLAAACGRREACHSAAELEARSDVLACFAGTTGCGRVLLRLRNEVLGVSCELPCVMEGTSRRMHGVEGALW